jgi:hypothetical protein
VVAFQAIALPVTVGQRLALIFTSIRGSCPVANSQPLSGGTLFYMQDGMSTWQPQTQSLPIETLIVR